MKSWRHVDWKVQLSPLFLRHAASRKMERPQNPKYNVIIECSLIWDKHYVIENTMYCLQNQ